MTQKIETRNATLADLAALLQDQQASKLDVVAPLAALTSRNGTITVAGTSVFGEGQRFLPTAIADGHIASKLGIPVTYLRTLRDERPDLFDANVNGWIKGGSTHTLGGTIAPVNFGADDRSVLLRTFQSSDVEGVGVLRAILSDRYGIVDNLDVLTAALEGVRASGTPVEVTGCDLTETRMTLRLTAPEIIATAPDLLKGYRSPFGEGGVFDHSGGQTTYYRGNLPQAIQDKYGADAHGVICAGLVITNSETGGGAFNIAPRFTVLACTNGLVISKDAMRQIHLGGRMEDGAVNWSDDTQRKSLELVTLKARDAIANFLDPEYLNRTIDGMTEKASTPITDPAKAIEVVGKKLLFSEATGAGVLDHFIKGGQVTAGGVMQAVTSFAQTVESADLAFDLEASAVSAMELVAAL